MQKEKLINIDAVTAKKSQLIELMAQNKIAFTMQGGTLGQTSPKLIECKGWDYPDTSYTLR